jgi:hypothetical protein
MSHRAKLLTTIATWHLACLAMMFVYGHILSHVVVVAYTEYFGDVQASYGRFERVATYLWIVAITSPATLISLLLFDRLSRRPAGSMLTAAVFCEWELVVIAVLIWSYEISFPFLVNQVGWAMFGPPEDIYSFPNLVLHRIIAWLLCTTPIAWLALWGHSKFAESRRHKGEAKGARLA